MTGKPWIWPAAVLAVALLALAPMGVWWFTSGTAAAFNGIELEEPRPAPAFSLPAAHGDTFRMPQDGGQVTLLFFGFTNCPDACPIAMRTFGAIADDLLENGETVKMLFVTVDPERDTPEQVREYLQRYGDHIVGLVGDREQLEPVWEAYGIYTERVDMPDSQLEYTLAHSTQISLVDPDGNLRLLYPTGTTAEEIAADVRRLLEEDG